MRNLANKSPEVASACTAKSANVTIIHYEKSHTRFRLAPKAMTLNTK